MKGIYALFIDLDTDEDIKVGSLGSVRFRKGHYIYIGSAMSGIEERIKRHLRNEKKIHWHIDYLLKHTKIYGAYYLEGEKNLECIWAKRLACKFRVIKKFGSSDCDCTGHLFYGEKEELIREVTGRKMKEFQM